LSGSGGVMSRTNPRAGCWRRGNPSGFASSRRSRRTRPSGASVDVVRLPELGEVLVQRRRCAGRRVSSRVARGSMPLRLSRCCQANGGEITMSPPMSWLQCMVAERGGQETRAVPRSV
jgi:hypothetical protein